MRNSFLILLAVLLSGISGCAGMQRMQDSDFRRAESLEQKKKYRDAAEVYEKIAAQSAGTALGADALYCAGRVRMLGDNPQKEYQRALQDFEEFLRTYPHNDRTGDVQTWRSLLRTIVELKKENERLSTNIEQLKRLDIRHEEQRRQ